MSKTARSPARSKYPMPVHVVFEHPAYVAMPVAGRGMLWSLCEHFWRTECVPRPKDDDQLFAIARAHRPTWRHHRAAILQVFDDVSPVLESYFLWRTSCGSQLRIAATRGAAVKTASAIVRRMPKSQSALEAPDNVSPILPRTDHATAQQKVLKVPDEPARPKMRDKAGKG